MTTVNEIVDTRNGYIDQLTAAITARDSEIHTLRQTVDQLTRRLTLMEAAMKITPREIAALTPTEQRNMARWIGEHSHLAELAATQKRRREIHREEQNGNDPEPVPVR